MGEDVDTREFTRADRQRHREKVRTCLDVFARMLGTSRFDFERPLTGLEIELNLVDGAGDPAMRNAEVLEQIADPAFQTELGQFNIEINIPPRQLAGDSLVGLETEIRAILNHAEALAQGIGAGIVMTGILPTIDKEHLVPESLSANPRYKMLNDQIFAARGEDLRLDIDGPERLHTYAD